MASKFAGKFEAAGRAGMRDKNTEKLVAVYPNKVLGTDKEVRLKINDWFSERNSGKDIQLSNYYVDTLTPVELKNSERIFTD